MQSQFSLPLSLTVQFLGFGGDSTQNLTLDLSKVEQDLYSSLRNYRIGSVEELPIQYFINYNVEFNRVEKIAWLEQKLKAKMKYAGTVESVRTSQYPPHLCAVICRCVAAGG